ncbi:AbrB family transcriptional regulator [Bifidobacterium sp. BRDM6]|uniref:AbrB family transcriptional regulator n=2 Tax=Bifidobacterium choloepi TaxID=2614131 RepID=A0A6I5MZE4_9BIFI|nr:AbrB family transcriptional regulator [Bifidobacterium choloepi]
MEAADEAEADGEVAEAGEQAAKAAAEEDVPEQKFEALTVTYERLRHSTDSGELHEFARRPLPDRADQAAFSRATALLEAVAGNLNTPEEDRVFLGETMPFPNILVKLSEDPSAVVRKAVAGNVDDKNWLVGRLTKDPDADVRDTALKNPQTSWKMRLEGAQNPECDAETLDFLAQFGAEEDSKAPKVLATMVRRAVALNPNTSAETLARLANDRESDVSRAAASRIG